jgi:hypothetical protein
MINTPDTTLSRALDQLESTPPHALLVGPPLSGKTSLLFTYAHSASLTGKRSLFFSYRSKPLVQGAHFSSASAPAKKPTHSSSLEHRLPALPRGLDMRDEILERIDIKCGSAFLYTRNLSLRSRCRSPLIISRHHIIPFPRYISSLDEFLFVLAHLHQYPSDRIPEAILVDDFLALCCAEVYVFSTTCPAHDWNYI